MALTRRNGLDSLGGSLVGVSKNITQNCFNSLLQDTGSLLKLYLHICKSEYRKYLFSFMSTTYSSIKRRHDCELQFVFS